MRVPEGWTYSQIGEIANIQVGRDLVEDCFSANITEDHCYPVYSNTVENRGLYGFYNFEEYSGNAITIVGRGIGLGTAFARYVSEPFGAIGRLLVLSPKNDSFDVSFLADYVNFCLRIHNESGGIPQLPGASLSRYYVTLPPLPEQQKIAQILSTWDKAIATCEQLLINSQQQKKALMQQLLTGKKRLLDEDGVRFCGVWQDFKLDELFYFKKGKGLSKGEVHELGKNKCVLYGELYTRYSEVINLIHSRTDSDDGTPSVSGDILMPSSTTTNGIDLANATAILEDNILLGGDINILRAKQSLSPIFMSHLLTHIKKDEIASRAQGITIIHLYGSDLKALMVKIPTDKDESEKIATVLTTADREIELIQTQLEALKQEKKALMQQLLTGKRRVVINH